MMSSEVRTTDHCIQIGRGTGCGTLCYSFSTDFELKKIRVGVTDTDPAVTAPSMSSIEVCASRDDPVPLRDSVFLLCGAMGRYLVIILERTVAMVLCEVEVFESKCIFLVHLIYSCNTSHK